METEGPPSELSLGLANDAADHRVQAGAVAAAGEHTDRVDLGGGHPADATAAEASRERYRPKPWQL